MTYVPSIELVRAPDIRTAGLDEAEWKIAWAIQHYISDIHTFYGDFRAAAALRQFSREQQAYDDGRTDPMDDDWIKLAGRAGGLAARNFGQSLPAVQTLIRKIPSFAEAIDLKTTGKVISAFSEAFPGIDLLRHAIAHPEFYADPRKDMTTTTSIPGFAEIQGDDVPYSARDSWMNDEFISTISGQPVSYRLNLGSVKKLKGIAEAFFDAVKPIAR